MQEVQETWVQSLSREDHWRRKWQPTPVLLSEKSHGQRSLVGLQRVRHNLVMKQQGAGPQWESELELGCSNKAQGERDHPWLRKRDTLCSHSNTNVKIVMNCCRALLYVADRIAHRYGSFRGYFGIMNTLFDLAILVWGIYSEEVTMNMDNDFLKH